jgi:hypothetical protein
MSLRQSEKILLCSLAVRRATRIISPRVGQVCFTLRQAGAEMWLPAYVCDAPLGSDYSVWSLLNRCADAILLAVSSHGP